MSVSVFVPVKLPHFGCDVNFCHQKISDSISTGCYDFTVHQFSISSFFKNVFSSFNLSAWPLEKILSGVYHCLISSHVKNVISPNHLLCTDYQKHLHLRTRLLRLAVTVLSPPQHLAAAKDFDSDSLRRYSWTADNLDNVNLVSSPIHSG